MRQLKIDPEFRDKVPPLTETEFATLEENIVKDGRVISPLIVWKDTIIDGHNRYAIVQKHPEIPFDVVERDFADRYEAVVWICRNQLGRRNLTDEQKTYLIGKQYEAQKLTNGGDRGNQHTKLASSHFGNLPTERTADLIAKEHKVGKNTVIRAEKFSKGIDAAEAISPGVKDKILSGAVDVPKSVIAAIPTMEEPKKEETIQAIKDGSYKRPVQEPKRSRNPLGFNREMREVRKNIDNAVDALYDQEREVIYTVDDLTTEIESMVMDFSSKVKRVIQNRSTTLNEDGAREKVIAALMEAETAIEKVRQLLS